MKFMLATALLQLLLLAPASMAAPTPMPVPDDPPVLDDAGLDLNISLTFKPQQKYSLPGSALFAYPEDDDE